MSEKLHDAIMDNNMKLLKSLLKDGADVNYKRDMDRGTPLHIAVQENNTEAARILLEAYADPFAYDIFEGTPDMLINEKTHPKIVEMFKDPGFPERFKRFLNNQKDVVNKEIESLSCNQTSSEAVKSRSERGVLLLEKIDAVNWLDLIDDWSKLINEYPISQSDQDRIEFTWDFEAQPCGLFMDIADQESRYIIIEIGNYYEDKIKENKWENLDWRSGDNSNDIDDHDLWFNIFFCAVKEALYVACERNNYNIKEVVIRYHYELDWTYIIYNGEICIPGWPIEEWRGSVY